MIENFPSPDSCSSFKVTVKPNALKDCVKLCPDGSLLLHVAAIADKGKANTRLVKFLSKELGHQVRIKSGLSSKHKVLVFV